MYRFFSGRKPMICLPNLSHVLSLSFLTLFCVFITSSILEDCDSSLPHRCTLSWSHQPSLTTGSRSESFTNQEPIVFFPEGIVDNLRQRAPPARSYTSTLYSDRSPTLSSPPRKDRPPARFSLLPLLVYRIGSHRTGRLSTSVEYSAQRRECQH